MRPGQNNKRMRGRPNNGRKGPNPLTRSYESSGPDVKIRGTAQHIGEKYLQLARDAQSSGDPVMAESYLQHAEHYFRLIAGAQQGFGAFQNPLAETNSEEAEDEADFGRIPDRFASPMERLAPAPQPGFMPQPMPQSLAPAGQPAPERPGHGNGDRQGYLRPERTRPERPNFRDRDFVPSPEKPYQEHRAFHERSGGGGREPENRGNPGRGPRDYRAERPFRADPRGDMQLAEPAVENNGLPAFITSPLRATAEPNDAAVSPDARPPLQSEPLDVNGTPGGYPNRPRRRRAGKVEPEAAGLGIGAGENAGDPVEE